jgi:hypothetical protein
VGRSGHNREAVSQRDRRGSLQARDLDHPCCSRKVQRQRGPKVSQRLIGSGVPLITRHSVVDLHQVHPAHDRAIRKRFLNPRERWLLSIQPSEDRPRVQADAHRGSRARSLSRRSAIPVFENRPPSRTGDLRATSTISSSRSSKSTSSPGCKCARSRSAFGITTCPFVPIRPVIPHKYNQPGGGCGPSLPRVTEGRGMAGRFSKSPWAPDPKAPRGDMVQGPVRVAWRPYG